MEIPEKYWQTRCGFQYYYEALRLCRKHAGEAKSVLEVGPRDTHFLDWVDWVPRKVAIDRYFQPEILDAESIQGNFLNWSLTDSFDLTVCLQVLEHLEEVVPFARKLRQTCYILVVSVPYKWPAGYCKWHRQDPVDLPKLVQWLGQPPLEFTIANDCGADRLVGVFRGDRIM
jgi:hypothetical protein